MHLKRTLGNKTLPYCNVQMQAVKLWRGSVRDRVYFSPCLTEPAAYRPPRHHTTHHDVSVRRPCKKVVPFRCAQRSARCYKYTLLDMSSSSQCVSACTAVMYRSAFLCTYGTCPRRCFPQASLAADWSACRTNGRARHAQRGLPRTACQKLVSAPP